MYIYININVHVYRNIYTYIYMYTYKYIYIYLYFYIYIYIFISIYIYLHRYRYMHCFFLVCPGLFDLTVATFDPRHLHRYDELAKDTKTILGEWWWTTSRLYPLEIGAESMLRPGKPFFPIRVVRWMTKKGWHVSSLD